MRFNLWEHSAQEHDPLCGTLLCLFVVLHRAALVERPEADLGVNLERPPLAIRRDRIVHLLYLGRDAPRLLAQPSRRPLPIDRACLCIGLRSQCRAAGRTLAGSLRHEGECLVSSSRPEGVAVAIFISQ